MREAQKRRMPMEQLIQFRRLPCLEAPARLPVASMSSNTERTCGVAAGSGHWVGAGLRPGLVSMPRQTQAAWRLLTAAPRLERS